MSNKDVLRWMKEEGHFACQPVVSGQLTRMVGLTMEAVGCRVKVGDRCRVEQGDDEIEAEVVGFDRERFFLMPIEPTQGLSPGAKVTPILDGDQIPVGDCLLGRVLNGAGQPLDDLGEIVSNETLNLEGRIINPMHRAPIRETMNVGIRAINSLLTVGRGQD